MVLGQVLGYPNVTVWHAPLEDALGHPEPLLPDTRERGAGAMWHFCALGARPLPQHEVIVCSRIHGIEHIGIVRNLQL